VEQLWLIFVRSAEHTTRTTHAARAPRRPSAHRCARNAPAERARRHRRAKHAPRPRAPPRREFTAGATRRVDLLCGADGANEEKQRAAHTHRRQQTAHGRTRCRTAQHIREKNEDVTHAHTRTPDASEWSRETQRDDDDGSGARAWTGMFSGFISCESNTPIILHAARDMWWPGEDDDNVLFFHRLPAAGTKSHPPDGV
jgi:hypothetical protein